MSDSPIASATGESLVDSLLPNCTDESLDEIGVTIFEDGKISVPVSPLDQLLAALTRRLLRESTLGGLAVVQLPRHRHRAALLLAVCSHLLCRRDLVLRGPVVLIGLDIDLTAQLRGLTVKNHRRMGLYSGNPLSAQRLTRLGECRPLVGAYCNHVDCSLIYFNTRVGAPTIDSREPLVIIDGTSITSPDARKRCFDWALRHGAAATVIIGDLGDDGLHGVAEAFGMKSVVLPVTSNETEQLVAEFGRQQATASTLSSMHLLWRCEPDNVVVRVDSAAVEESIARAFRCLGAMPPGPLPHELEIPTKLLRSAMRLAATTTDYRTACTNNARVGEGPIVLLRRLERANFRGVGPWHAWGVAHWGALKMAVQNLWKTIEAENPKLQALWRVLDDLDRSTTGQIVIRCHSRAGAEATRNSLQSSLTSPTQSDLLGRLGSRLTIATMKERFEAGAVEAQVITGMPPPWHFSHLLSVEAKQTHLLLYETEERSLRRRANDWAIKTSAKRNESFDVLGVDHPSLIATPMPEMEDRSISKAVHEISVPGLSLVEVIERASRAVDMPEVQLSSESNGVRGTRSCIPVRLEDGRTWWCVDDGERTTPVLVISAGGHHHVVVGRLKSGDRIIVPAGEGVDSVHARLVAASRSSSDVASLDLLLTQFRKAAKSVLAASRSKRDAVQKVRDAGAVAGELEAWASGATIAPRDPGDVEAVFKAAKMPMPDLSLLYAVATSLRSLSATLSRFAVAIAEGRGDASIEKLRALVGDSVEELLDEFVVVDVQGIGPTEQVSTGIAGRLV